MTPNQYLLREQPIQPLAALVGGLIVIIVAALMLGFGVSTTTGAGAHHGTHPVGLVAAPRR